MDIPLRQITPTELKSALDRHEIVLIDVREPFEREIASIGGELIPKDTVFENVAKIPKDKPVCVYCRSGGRSGWVIRELQNRLGFRNLVNLAGGILRWSDEIDPSVRKY